MWPDDTPPQAAPPRHPQDGGSTEPSSSPTRSFNSRSGGTYAPTPIPTLDVTTLGLNDTALPKAVERLNHYRELYDTFIAHAGDGDWDLTTLVSLIDEIDHMCHRAGQYSEHATYWEYLTSHRSDFEGLITRLIDHLCLIDDDCMSMIDHLRAERLRLKESLRPLTKTFNGLQLASPEYKRLLNKMRAVKCDELYAEWLRVFVVCNLYSVRMLRAQMRCFQGHTLPMSRIASWTAKCKAKQSLIRTLHEERTSLQLDMAQTEAELAGLDLTEEPRFQEGIDTTEEGVLSQTSCQEDDNSTSHSPGEVEDDIDISGTAFEEVAPPTDDSTSHFPTEVEGDIETTGAATVPIGANDDVPCEDDALPQNVTTPTDSPPSGDRELYKFILTKSGMDHKPVSLIQATAATLPRQKTSPSCAPSLMAPANNITTPMTGGQGKGAPAKAPPRQLTGQLGRRGKQNQITILQRAGGPCEPTRAPHVTAPAPESPKGGDKKKSTKKGGKKRSQLDERERGAPAPPPSHVPASHAPQVSDTTAGPRRLHPTSSTRRLWTAGSRRKSTPTVTVPRHELAQLRQSKRDLQMLTWRYACLRQAHHRLTQEIDQSTAAVPIHGEDDDDDDDDDEATVATSNLTGIDSCENVPAQLDDGDDDDDVTPASEDDVADGMDGDTYGGGAPVYRDCPNNLQSVHTAPLLAFGLAPATTDDIRQIETNNLQQSQDIEGLPLVPKRKRRRKRKRKRPRRRKGQANKPRPKHSPVTPPRRHTNVRRQAAKTAKTHESFPKEFQAYFYSNAAKYCPASGFDTNWHRKGIG